MKRFFAILTVLLILALTFTGCGQKTDENTVTVQEGKFILGLDDSFPPMGYTDENGDIVGFDIDIAKEVCAKLGYELVLQPINWNSKEVELNGGAVDCLWNGFSINEKRKESMNLSIPYMKNTQAVVVLADSDIKTLADLSGKIVGVQAGSTAMDAIDANPEVKESFGELIEIDDNMMAIQELKNGTIDALVADEILINYYTSSESDAYRLLDENLGEEEYAIGFKKGNDALTEQVNGALKELVADGTFAEISKKWFGKDVSIID